TGKPEKDIAAKMAATTWFTAQEAKDYGFVDAVIEAIEMKAKSDEFLARFPNAPKGVGAPEKTGAKASANTQTMKLLLAALAAARLIPSADLTDEAATAAFNASFGPINTELETLRAAQVDAFKAKAEAEVDACFADGRLSAKDDAAKAKLREGWIKAYSAN